MNSIDTSLTRKTNRAKHGRQVINPGTLYSYDLHMSMHHKVVVNAEEWGGRGAVHSSNFRHFQIPDSQCTLPHTLKFCTCTLNTLAYSSYVTAVCHFRLIFLQPTFTACNSSAVFCPACLRSRSCFILSHFPLACSPRCFGPYPHTPTRNASVPSCGCHCRKRGQVQTKR